MLSGGDQSVERIVPRSGFTMTLTLAAAAAMAFLAVFVAAVAGGADRLADAWEDSLTGTATVRAPVALGDGDALAQALGQVLDQTPGIETRRRIGTDEQAALLSPWFGDEIPLDLLNLPVLIEVTLTDEGPDAEELTDRLRAVSPEAVYDDHGQWQAPVQAAASRLRLLALTSLLVIGLITAAVLALAANASLAANGRIIDVLRLVGASDRFITRLFVRRFAVRAAAGAAIGSLIGLLAVLAVPAPDAATGAPGVGFSGAGWSWPFIVPVLAAIIAYGATRAAAARRLRDIS
ncbi:cell division protein FtsX [Alphaproteobacteria bacterium GH1-50]|uniref:Cell division protein FtsX n=1 Tax=Kangsaoukella pontilimi TaxID=2691042 RepID=A0A7C9J5G1_9RHOB|nr:FtsX-like permease family protein [Kangsaoukella pontilimi]MXQ09341.1 cell division protein FtsX [Kangsaoukella pontilimi]